jgi:hypothetical protein
MSQSPDNFPNRNQSDIESGFVFEMSQSDRFSLEDVFLGSSKETFVRFNFSHTSRDHDFSCLASSMHNQTA